MSKKVKKNKVKFPATIYVTLDKDGDITYTNAWTEPEGLLPETGEAELVGTYTFESKAKMKMTRVVEVL